MSLNYLRWFFMQSSPLVCAFGFLSTFWWQVLLLLCQRYFQFMLLSGMIVNWGMLPLASSCRCLSSVCINTSAALRFKKKKKSVYPETVDIWGLLQMLPAYIPNIWIKYLVIIFQHSLQLTPFGLNLWFNQISTSIFFLLEMQWRQNHSVYMWCPQMGVAVFSWPVLFVCFNASGSCCHKNSSHE